MVITKNKIKILIIFLLFSVFCFSEIIKIASFNTLRLGESKKNYKVMARIIKKFDIIALQEVMNENGLKKLRTNLRLESGEEWDYIISEKAVGSKSYKEYYAFLYKKSKVSEAKAIGFYKDSKTTEFMRPPYGAKFISNNFSFILVSSHSVYGKTIEGRVKEAEKYSDVYKYFLEKTNEDDIIIVGDFNLPANNDAFKNLYEDHNVRYVLNPSKNKTTISNTGRLNSYDNIFLNMEKTKEFTGRYGVYDFTKNNNITVRKFISDHSLIFAEFENSYNLD